MPDRKPESDGTTPSNVRGDIQRGLAGDKKPGFDPAAAPMETDAESGGTPTTAEAAATDRQAQWNPNPSDYQGSKASAMREFDTPPPRKAAWPVGKLLLVAIVIAILAGAAALVFGGLV
ncbi:hypothetical protein [Roseibium salinum]|uniref:Uncharacterized protein n=1 Tax=Roseibium salinum TaxID=1604349 RepID=A0ABT3QXJ5_9HYPH|nr:hypothetical protein [Roseibium sp. DSM 29163]MCX2721627.1 hypothetical protein [Roseibium sp. DSM 29163]